MGQFESFQSGMDFSEKKKTPFEQFRADVANPIDRDGTPSMNVDEIQTLATFASRSLGKAQDEIRSTIASMTNITDKGEVQGFNINTVNGHRFRLERLLNVSTLSKFTDGFATAKNDSGEVFICQKSGEKFTSLEALQSAKELAEKGRIAKPSLRLPEEPGHWMDEVESVFPNDERPEAVAETDHRPTNGHDHGPRIEIFNSQPSSNGAASSNGAITNEQDLGNNPSQPEFQAEQSDSANNQFPNWVVNDIVGSEPMFHGVNRIANILKTQYPLEALEAGIPPNQIQWTINNGYLSNTQRMRMERDSENKTVSDNFLYDIHHPDTPLTHFDVVDYFNNQLVDRNVEPFQDDGYPEPEDELEN